MASLPASILAFPLPDGDPASEPAAPRRRGAPLGNQNARKDKQGAASANSEYVTQVLVALQEMKGCAQEIAMLRVRIHAMFLRNAPDEDFMRACTVLNRLLVTHHLLTQAGLDLTQEN